MSSRVFVTGGSRGIGGAVSRALAARGADVAIGYRERRAEAESTAEAVRAHGRRAVLVPGDVSGSIEELVDRAAGELEGLDGFVSCAVLPLPLPITELGREDLERTLRTNADPFVLGAVAAARHMEHGGRIVALSATGAHRIRNPRYAPLGLAKGTVNAVAPGPTDTEAFDTMAEDPGPLRERLAGVTPMGRMGTPEDAARLIAFLCSEDAGWVTGQLIFSDGGYSLV